MVNLFFQFVRWPNLLMVAIIQFLVYARLLAPDTCLDMTNFILLTSITIIITAGGFVINDYYDEQIDRVNRPARLIAGNTWTLREVKSIYAVLVIIGGILSIGLALRIDLFPFLGLYPLATLALWLYSYGLKCKPLIGNVWVSLFCAGVVFIVALPDLLLRHDGAIPGNLWIFMLFAFLTTLYREVVKDLEDYEGDRKMECQTFAVRFGMNAARIMTILAGMLLLASLYWWDSIQDNPTVRLVLIMLQGAVVASMAFVWWAKRVTYYHTASTLIKIVMIAGTLLLVIL